MQQIIEDNIQELIQEDKNMKYGMAHLVEMDVLNHNVESILAGYLMMDANDLNELIEEQKDALFEAKYDELHKDSDVESDDEIEEINYYRHQDEDAE